MLIITLTVLVIGYLLIARPDIPLRWQTWSQKTIMGATYIPGPRTHTIMRVVGVIFVIFMLFVSAAIFFGTGEGPVTQDSENIVPDSNWQEALYRDDCRVLNGTWENEACTIPMEEQIRVKEAELTCLKEGGAWGRTGVSIREECNLPTKDGGEVCTDYSECEGTCVGEAGATSGKCTGWTITKGCYAVVRNGKADERALCTD
ncbi:MAG: hypothetical protein A3H76_01445 [Candidatus Lloydbacteria bacterium RIFCSPLOWO2_02_FULL_54_12]|nr:MAG: hypothetical protein A3H76_01445 [Candidatus Lloydbacteria bacterium RIFCSPLOWO2_02_FULL_54_12]